MALELEKVCVRENDQSSKKNGGINMVWKTLPIGIDNFRKLREENYYYIDKTLFIK